MGDRTTLDRRRRAQEAEDGPGDYAAQPQAPAPVAEVLALQRTMGNAAVGRLLARRQTIARKETKTDPIASPGGEFTGKDAGGQPAVMNPTGKKLHDVFSLVLGVDGGQTEPWTIYDLAEALGVTGFMRRIFPFPIAPGDPKSLITALDDIALALEQAKAAQEVPADEAPRIAERIAQLKLFAEARSADGAKKVTPMRQMIVSIAISQIGAVNDRAEGGTDPNDPKKREFRRGHERLHEYFSTAWGGQDDKKKVDPDKIAHFPEHRNPAKDDLAEWCGLFALWVYRSAGLTTGNWKQSRGASSVGGIEQVTDLKKVKPGDIGYIDKVGDKVTNHHFIVAEVLAGGKIRTVEGNTNPGGSHTGGQIASHVKNMSGILFYTATALKESDPPEPKAEKKK